jgi:phenylalanyl-tRNA synthetase alpha chain
MNIHQKIEEINNLFDQDLKTTEQYGAFDELYLKYFSKTHGLTTQLVKELANMAPEQKKELGPLINQVQNDQKTAIENAKENFAQRQLSDPSIDLTLPQSPIATGYIHPVNQVIRQMNEFFRYHGYSVYEGPEIETEEFNFRKLNLPEGHPATDL